MIDYTQYTHYGTFYGIPIFFDMRDNGMAGQNAFYDGLLFFMSPVIELVIFICRKLNRNYTGKVGINLQGEIDDVGNFRPN